MNASAVLCFWCVRWCHVSIVLWEVVKRKGWKIKKITKICTKIYKYVCGISSEEMNFEWIGLVKKQVRMYMCGYFDDDTSWAEMVGVIDCFVYFVNWLKVKRIPWHDMFSFPLGTHVYALYSAYTLNMLCIHDQQGRKQVY